jgi:hypothetical protein
MPLGYPLRKEGNETYLIGTGCENTLTVCRLISFVIVHNILLPLIGPDVFTKAPLVYNFLCWLPFCL